MYFKLVKLLVLLFGGIRFIVRVVLLTHLGVSTVFGGQTAFQWILVSEGLSVVERVVDDREPI